MDTYYFYIPQIEYFTYRKCTENWLIERSLIDFHDITYVISGNGTYFVNDNPIHVKSGDIIYIPPGNIRSATTCVNTPMEVYSVNFILMAINNVNNNSVYPFLTLNYIGLETRLIFLFCQLAKIWNEKNDNYEMDARSVFLQILSELLKYFYIKKPLLAYDRRIELVKDYIVNNFHTQINIKILANLVSLNDIYLGALFKNVTGVTIKEYINIFRINSAYDILKTENTSIQDVAFRCGFSDQFYFSRVFKKYKGYQPSSVRNNQSPDA
jgi:AraC-like DNA-binding protein